MLTRNFPDTLLSCHLVCVLCNIGIQCGYICLFCWSKFLSLSTILSHLLLLLSLSDSDVFGRIASVCLSVLHVEHHPEFAPAISNVRYVGHAFCGFGYLGEGHNRCRNRFIETHQAGEGSAAVFTFPAPSFGHSVVHIIPPLVGRYATPVST